MPLQISVSENVLAFNKMTKRLTIVRLIGYFAVVFYKLCKILKVTVGENVMRRTLSLALVMYTWN